MDFQSVLDGLGSPSYVIFFPAGAIALSDDMRSAIKALLTVPRNKPSHRSQFRRIIAREGGPAGRHRKTSVANWPHHSEALGVNPDQIGEATEALRRAGVLADFDPQGRLVITSERQYREAARAVGMFTGRDGYGTLNDAGVREDTGRVQKDRRDRFRREVEKYDRHQDCDPEVAALFEAV